MASHALKALRLYGVVDADTSDPRLLETDDVSLVTFRDLAAVVSPTAYVRVKPDHADIENYLHVIDSLSAHGPVVPAPPGTVFRDESVLARWLDVHYAKLHEAMGLIEQRTDGRPPYEYVRMELGG